MTPEMHIVEMNAFGARHSHVDTEVVRGQSIYDILPTCTGHPRRISPGSYPWRILSLAQAGAASQVTDLPCLVLDAQGRTANGGWNARIRPIFDDGAHLLGFVEWAEPFTAPTRGGRTKVRVSKRTA